MNAVDDTDPKLWAHERMHVMQYAKWGVAGFASRYLVDHARIEGEAVLGREGSGSSASPRISKSRRGLEIAACSHLEILDVSGPVAIAVGSPSTTCR